MKKILIILLASFSILLLISQVSEYSNKETFYSESTYGEYADSNEKASVINDVESVENNYSDDVVITSTTKDNNIAKQSNENNLNYSDEVNKQDNNVQDTLNDSIIEDNKIISNDIIKEDKVLQNKLLRNNKNIILIDKSEGNYCAQAIEYFYEDANYKYYFTCIKSQYMFVIKAGKEYKLVEALNNKIVTIEELEENGYKFPKEEKNLVSK